MINELCNIRETEKIEIPDSCRIFRSTFTQLKEQ